jgi:hypothetical protein
MLSHVLAAVQWKAGPHPPAPPRSTRSGAGGAFTSIGAALVSPSSAASSSEEPLSPVPGGYATASGEHFRIVDGVALLIQQESLRELYPELAGE